MDPRFSIETPEDHLRESLTLSESPSAQAEERMKGERRQQAIRIDTSAEAMQRASVGGAVMSGKAPDSALKNFPTMVDASDAGMAQAAAGGAVASTKDTGRLDPERAAFLAQPVHRQAISGVLHTVTGYSLDEIEEAVKTGTLKDKVGLKLLDPLGNTLESVARAEATKQGLPPELVDELAMSAGLLAGLLTPGSWGSKGRHVAEGLLKRGAKEVAAEMAGKVEKGVAEFRAGAQRAESAVSKVENLAAHAGDVPPLSPWKFSKEAYDAGLKEYRAGVRVPTAETRAKGELLARQQADDLIMSAKPERAMAAEEAYAFVRMEELSADRAKFLARNFLENPGDEHALREFAEHLDAHMEISVRRQGGRAEAGRALNIFNDPTSASVGRVDDFLKTLESAAPDAGAEAVAFRILTSRDPAKMLNEASSAWSASGIKDGMTTAWYNSILSGSDTHIANLLDTAARVYFIEPLAKLGPAAIRWAPQQVGLWQNGERLSEAMAFAKVVWNPMETLRAIRKASGDFVKKYTDEGAEAALDMGKLDLPRVPVDHQTAGLTEDASALGWGTRALSSLWGLAQTPTRLLASEDQFYRIVASRAITEEHAVRGANEAVRLAGLAPGSDEARALFKQMVDDLRVNPTPAARAATRDYGSYIALQTDLGRIAQKGQDLIDAVPFVGRAVVPFLRTTVNMAKSTWDHIPGTPLLSAMSSKYRNAWADPIERNVMLGRQGAGMVLGGAFAYYASTGNITGSIPRDPGQRRTNEAVGVEPHSTYIPGYGWIKHERLGLIGRMLSLSADAALIHNLLGDEDVETSELLSMTIGAAYGALVLDPTYSKGLRDVTDLVMDPSEPSTWQRVQGWMEKQAASAVPRIVNQVRSATDDIVREAEGVVARIKDRLPGLSESLPPLYDTITGKPRRVAGEWWQIFADPTRRDQPPVTVPAYISEMYELGMKAPIVPRRMTTFRDQPLDRAVEVPPLMRNEIAKVAHQLVLGEATLQQRLNDVVNKPLYKKATPDEKAAIIRELFSIYMDQARELLIDSGKFMDFNEKLNTSITRANDRQRVARDAAATQPADPAAQMIEGLTGYKVTGKR